LSQHYRLNQEKVMTLKAKTKEMKEMKEMMEMEQKTRAGYPR
jgi:hypothetical protein